MRVLVTGGGGFAGRWLIRELGAHGHEAIAAPPRGELDITDADAVLRLARDRAPDVIGHLAAVAFGPDARRDPDRATAVNVGGTEAVVRAAAQIGAGVLLVSSSEVYGPPDPADLPLDEAAPLRAEQPYGRSKIAAEAVAREIVARAAAGTVRLAIVRPFNHTGPGQRREFVVPALAERILAAREAGASTIRVGNVDVRRDFSDVRDVVAAYRLVLERLAGGDVEDGEVPVFNVASERSASIREIAVALAAEAGIAIGFEIDPALVRASDPPEIRGDASAIRRALGWTATTPLERTLRDVLADVTASARATARPDPAGRAPVPPG
ncbi:MAG TPA: NAD-dependent epimerase/dehydratase family protein [Candidatus Limnocylindrales bacterium]